MRARGVQQVLAPVVDVARDPRWGRIEETFGEDTYLVTRMGMAAVNGFQGRRPTVDAPIDGTHVMATLKHMTGHGYAEGGRNTAPAIASPRMLHEVWFDCRQPRLERRRDRAFRRWRGRAFARRGQRAGQDRRRHCAGPWSK
jgi:beta-glucosidase